VVDSKTFAKNSESSGWGEDGGFDGNGEDTPLNRLQERNYFREGEGRGSSAIITIEMWLSDVRCNGGDCCRSWRSNVGTQWLGGANFRV